MGRIKLRLENNTKWSTRDLRKFFLRGMKDRGMDHLHVTVDYARSNDGVHGSAYLNSVFLRMKLPGPKWVRVATKHNKPLIDMKKFAQVFMHEMDHCLGLRHKDMADWWKFEPTWQEGLEIKWTGDTVVEKKTSEQKQAARTATVETRAQHALAMLKKADTRLKQATTIQKKWAKKVKYYQDRGVLPGDE